MLGVDDRGAGNQQVVGVDDELAILGDQSRVENIDLRDVTLDVVVRLDDANEVAALERVVNQQDEERGDVSTDEQRRIPEQR